MAPSNPQPRVDVDFGLATNYDTGVRPGIALNRNLTVLEVHEAEVLDKVWYRVGRVNRTEIEWGGSNRYDDGKTPSCGLNAANVAVEVHKAQYWNQLWYRVGTVDPGNNTVSWGSSSNYAPGTEPSVALNDAGIVVEVHSDWDQTKPDSLVASLKYHLGRVNGSSITWQVSNQLYDHGACPQVAINNSNIAVEVHGVGKAMLCCRVGQIGSSSIAWGPASVFDQKDSADEEDCTEPSVTVTDDGTVITVYEKKGRLWSRTGTISGSAISWGPAVAFDDGRFPSVAASGAVAVQAHGTSSSFKAGLWASASLILDRSRWMENHLPLLGKRSLRLLTLPASHDAGMYTGNGLDILGKTQDLRIYDQLAHGVRYFDLRPEWTASAFSAYHGPITGPSFTEILGDVQRFLTEGRREVVILKISHYDDFDDDIYKSFVGLVKQHLDPWLFKQLPEGKRLADIPLEDLIRNGGIVLPVCDGGYPVTNREPGFWVYRDDDDGDAAQGDLRVFDKYANTTSFDTMKADQLKKFNDYTGACRSNASIPCDLFLLSWTLTPVTGVWMYAQEANRKLGAEVRSFPRFNSHGWDRIVNLLYVDYAQYARVTDVALHRNYAALGKRVGLRTENKSYLCAEGGGGRELVANRTAMDSWATFLLHDLGDGKVALQAASGHFVCAEKGGGQGLYANRPCIGSWETFERVDRGNGSLALRASDGHFVCAESGGGGRVVANRDAAGGWETFEVIPA